MSATSTPYTTAIVSQHSERVQRVLNPLLNLWLIVAIVATASLGLFSVLGVNVDPLISIGVCSIMVVVYLASAQAVGLPALSLTNVAVVFYLYVLQAFFLPVLNQNLYFSVHSQFFQTPEIISKAVLLITVGFSAFLVGWIFSQTRSRTLSRRVLCKRQPLFPIRKVDFYIAVLLAVPCFVLAMPRENIFSTGYGNAAATSTSADLELHTIKPALYICLLIALAATRKMRSRGATVLFYSFFVISLLLVGFGAGNRVEEMGCIMAAAWLLQIRRPTFETPRAWIVSGIVFTLILLVLGEVRNEIPTMLAEGRFDLTEMVGKTFSGFDGKSTGTMKPTTNGDVALTLCATIGLVDSGAIPHDYGLVFAQYLNMTLPRFVNPNRPLEFQNQLRLLTPTGGGLCILAEPYVAAGTLGIIVFMCMNGLVFGNLEARYLSGRLTGKLVVAYVLLLSCVPRTYLYSTFSGYKHIITGLIIIGLVIVLRVFNGDTGQRIRTRTAMSLLGPSPVGQV